MCIRDSHKYSVHNPMYLLKHYNNHMIPQLNTSLYSSTNSCSFSSSCVVIPSSAVFTCRVGPYCICGLYKVIGCLLYTSRCV